jgi:hypothetical protein
MVRPFWTRFFKEFECSGCGNEGAYRSRSRGFFDRYAIPLLLLQPVRCDCCSKRTYVLRTIRVPERRQSEGRKTADTSADGSSSVNRIA